MTDAHSTGTTATEVEPAVEAEPITRTEAATRLRPADRAKPAWRRWLRRRPVRRALVLTHRWTAIVLGLFLLVECTSGVLVLYHTEYFRATHSTLYHHTASSHPISAERAAATVHKAHPDFPIGWVSKDNGIYAVGDVAFTSVWGVDPGTGRITTRASLVHGPMEFLVNLHDCGFTCPGNTGYWPVLAHTVPTLGAGWLVGVTWGHAILGVLGLLLVLLAVTGLITWWPGMKRMSHGFRVRTGKGRFARDYDLHNVVGLVAVPFLLMWGVTGAAIYFPGVEKAWLTITGGHTPAADQFAFTPAKAAPHAKDIGLDKAIATALDKVPGTMAYTDLPSAQVPYYSVIIRSGYSAYRHRAFYSGDRYVYVDSHDASHLKVTDLSKGPTANVFYARMFEASHFGWNVNVWWRTIWTIFGLTPLVLGITGLSTWLFRRGTRRRRRSAAA